MGIIEHENLQKQLSELKERNVYYHHWVQSKLDEYDNRILIAENNKEVLRDHIKWHKTPTYKGKNDESLELDKQLEKLDSGGKKIDFPKNVDIERKPLIYANYDKDDLNKPPEPNLTSLNYHFEKEFGDRLPGGTGKEPRENDLPELYTSGIQKRIDESNQELISEFVEKMKGLDKKDDVYLRYYLDELINEYEDKLK